MFVSHTVSESSRPLSKVLTENTQHQPGQLALNLPDFYNPKMLFVNVEREIKSTDA